jgi:hypothetical protein
MSEPMVSSPSAIEQLTRADQRSDAAIRAFDDYPTPLRTLADAADLRSRGRNTACSTNAHPMPNRSRAAGLGRVAPIAWYRRVCKALHTDLQGRRRQNSVSAAAYSVAASSVRPSPRGGSLLAGSHQRRPTHLGLASDMEPGRSILSSADSSHRRLSFPIGIRWLSVPAACGSPLSLSH